MPEKENKVQVLQLEDNEDDALLVKMGIEKVLNNVAFKHIKTKSELLKENFFDYNLICLDYNLPDYNGLEATRWIRNKGYEDPLIVISGTLGDELAVDLLREGASDFVLKTNLKKLPYAVKRVMKESALAMERRKFHDELVEKNRILDAIFEGFLDPLMIKDVNKRYIKVNRAFCELRDMTEEEIIGRTEGEVDYNDLDETVAKHEDYVLKSGKTAYYENEFTTGDGKIFYFEGFHAPIIIDGVITGIVGSERDITTRKEMQDHAEMMQRILNQAEKLTKSGSFEYDAALDILTCSPNFMRMLGLRVDQNKISFQMLVRFIKLEDRTFFLEGINEAISGTKEFFRTFRYQLPDADEGSIEILFRPNYKGDDKSKYYGTIVDVTSEQQYSVSLMDKQEEDRKEIARELHDNLGQKLTASALYINRISEEFKDHEALATAKELIHECIGDLSSIMNTISVKQIEEHSLEYALGRLCNFVRSKVNVDFHYNVDEDKLSRAIKVQAYRITQEALNNVSKYSKAGDAIVDVKSDGSILDLTIKDNGIGFEVEKNASGNGLSNIRHRVKKSNGLVDIHSEKNNGTIITVKLPVS